MAGPLGVALGLALGLAGLAGCAGHGHLSAPDELGEVSFPVSCDPAVQEEFDRAVATLHSFEFDEARGRFEEVAAADPDCAMAFWGLAMTDYHPLWPPPTPRELARGATALARARELSATDRERLYIEAIGAFYDGAEHVGHRERKVRYEEAMGHLHRRHPEDREAQLFYALAVLSNADPRDKSYAVPKRSGALVEPLFAELPRHPGVVHYLIHSYDYPPLAPRAVEAAHRYLEIAPSMPHALHMSGHIFTQLGMWQDSIEANTLSAEAARARAGRFGSNPQAWKNEVHALDYLVYAYLQRGDDEAALQVVETLDERGALDWRNPVAAYNAGAIPVRYALERREWRAAASLPELTAADRAGQPAATQAAVLLRIWARALGAARSGDLARAEREVAELERRAAALRGSDDVWLRNTSEVLRLQATGWLALAQGDPGHAESLLRAAAELEDETDKSGISPGRVLPAHEQLGDLLLLLGRPREAYAEYRAALESAPRRYRSVLGSARAALASGQPRLARDAYTELLVLAPESTRPENDEARQLAAALGS